MSERLISAYKLFLYGKGLSVTEVEVATHLVMNGDRKKLMLDRSISEKTLKFHLGNIYKKTKCIDQLAFLAMSLKVITEAKLAKRRPRLPKL